MPAVDRIAAFADDMRAWRRAMQRHPETGIDLPWTAGRVADRTSTTARRPQGRRSSPG